MKNMEETKHSFGVAPEAEVEVHSRETSQKNHGKIGHQAVDDPGAARTVFWHLQHQNQIERQEEFHEDVKRNLLGGNKRKKQIGKHKENNQERGDNAALKETQIIFAGHKLLVNDFNFLYFSTQAPQSK